MNKELTKFNYVFSCGISELLTSSDELGDKAFEKGKAEYEEVIAELEAAKARNDGSFEEIFAELQDKLFVPEPDKVSFEDFKASYTLLSGLHYFLKTLTTFEGQKEFYAWLLTQKDFNND